jgi:hypothetical protein
MVYSVQQIKYEILAYIKEFGGSFGDYYVGLTDDPQKALFETHGLVKNRDPWLYKQALSFAAARTVQQYFVDRLHTDGEPAVAGSEDVDCVYVYRKSMGTRP